MPLKTTANSNQGIWPSQTRLSSSVNRWNGLRYSVQPLPKAISAKRNNSQGNRNGFSLSTQAGIGLFRALHTFCQ